MPTRAGGTGAVCADGEVVGDQGAVTPVAAGADVPLGTCCIGALPGICGGGPTGAGDDGAATGVCGWPTVGVCGGIVGRGSG